jgi:putative membrane protein
MEGSQFDERDATRRTRLAAERTYLAWWRSGLTAIAVSLASGRLVPELSSGLRWPSELVGAGFGVLGLACAAYAYRRQQQVEAALARGEYAPLGTGFALALTVGTVLLGAATVLIVIFQG